MNLSPKQLHYFKRELITEQLEKEIDLLNRSTSDTFLTNQKNSTDFPFLSYAFDNLIVEFPLLKHTCDEDFWPKCQLLLEEFNKAHLGGYYVPSKMTSTLHRKKIQYKIQKSLVFAFCTGINTLQGPEESIRIDQPISTSPSSLTHLLQINIVAVRQATKKQTLREVSHAEFLIESKTEDKEPIYVARRHGDFRRLREELKHQFQQQHLDIPPVPSKSSQQSTLYREHDRLLLRAFLNHLAGQPQIRKSQVFKEFLRDRPVVFTPAEEQDALQRQEADQKRWAEQERFKKELNRRVFELNDTLEELKHQIIQPGGLIDVFDIVKKTKLAQDLPDSLKKAFEWGRVSFAFALHRQFISAETAMENFHGLKRTHALMPYKTLSIILRFSNPMVIVKSILDLFLAQPFGQKSLFQRMLISNMSEDAKSSEREIKQLENTIQNKTVCQKLHQAVRTPLPTNHQPIKTTKRMELLTVLNNAAIEPSLTEDELHSVQHKLDSLVRLWELYAQQYEQERMIELVFQGVTGELLREFISVFYQPLAQVYKAADISTTIRHVALFVDDLIQVVTEQTDAPSQTVSDSIQPFIELVQRHEDNFYQFVHNVHSQESSNVFDELIRYVDKLFSFVVQGIPGQVDLDACVAEAGIQSKEDKTQLVAEIDAICDYRYKQKAYRLERQKRKMMMHSSKDMAFLIQEQQGIDYITKDIVALQDMDELVFEEEEEEEREEEVEEGYVSQTSSQSSGSHISHKGIEKPLIRLIPTVLDHFIYQVKNIMYK